jgi:hypothetical protein
MEATRAPPSLPQPPVPRSSPCSNPSGPRRARRGVLLIPRQGAWSRRRRARRGRVSPPFAPLQSRLKSSPPAFPKRPSRGHCPAAPVRLHPPPSCAACPGRAQRRYALRRAAPAGCRAPSASWARGGHRRGGQGGRREKWLYISYYVGEMGPFGTDRHCLAPSLCTVGHGGRSYPK